MSLVTFMGQLQATAGMHDAAKGYFAAQNARMDLANQAGNTIISRQLDASDVYFGGDTVTLSTRQAERLTTQDKLLAMKAQMFDFLHKLYTEMMERATRMQQREDEMKDRLRKNGATFV